MLEPAYDDGSDHLTACLHPLAAGEDMSLDRPQIEDSEILAAPAPGSELAKEIRDEPGPH